ncbi:MAG: DUF1543 domain-containing protein [Chitinophagaceae bacterium]
MQPMKLFMALLGCKPKARHTEQHDIFFGIGLSLKDLVPDIIQSWPEAKGKIHIDAWREVNYVDQHIVQILTKERPSMNIDAHTQKLFFINLGGYKQNEFEEYHYKVLVAGENKFFAIQRAKATAFYKHTGFKGAESHVDDKYGVDVDDIYEIEDILPLRLKSKYSIELSPVANAEEDELHLGYFQLHKL